MNRRTDIFLSGTALLSAALSVFFIFFLGEANPLREPPQPIALEIVLTLVIGTAALVMYLAWWFGERPAAVGLPPASGNAGLVWTPRAVIVSLIVVGFVLRVVDIRRFGLCNDEALFVFASGHETLADTLRDSLTHFHPPTNFLVLHYLLKISWDPLWIRLPALLGGTAAIGCTYLLVRGMFGTLAGLLAAFFVAFSPNLILLSQVCRNYSPSMPFFLLSFHYLSRYLRERKPWMLSAFAAFEVAAILWHYAFLPLFLGANVVLFAVLLRGERPLRTMFRAALVQAPVGVLYAVAFLFHLPITQAGQRTKVAAYMAEEFNLDPRNPLLQLFALVKYLVADSPDLFYFLPAALFFVGFVVGCAALWRLRLRWQTALCLAFIPFAYAFAFWLKLLPFGGTRHSYYAFPFLFAPAAALAALLVLGRDAFLAEAARTGAATARTPRSAYRLIAGLAMIAVCGVYLFGAVRLVSYVAPYYLRQSPVFKERRVFYKAEFYKPVELPTRVDDLDLLAQSILNYVPPGEIVLTSLPVFMILKAHLEEEPASLFFDLNAEREFDWKGRRFVYIPENYLGFTPDSLLIAVTALARRRDLPDSARVWVGLAGWELWGQAMYWGLLKPYPDVMVPGSAPQASREMLMAIRVGPARVITRGVLELNPEAAAPPVQGAD